MQSRCWDVGAQFPSPLSVRPADDVTAYSAQSLLISQTIGLLNLSPSQPSSTCSSAHAGEQSNEEKPIQDMLLLAIEFLNMATGKLDKFLRQLCNV